MTTFPCDWDGEAYCAVPDCTQPATHEQLAGMVGASEVVELVCCRHAAREEQP